MKTITTHFKRHGSASWLEVRGLEKYYIECNYNNTSKKTFLNVTEDRSIPKEWNGKQYFETHTYNIIHKEIEEFNYDIIQNEINSVLTDIQINLEHFIESYHIPQKDHPEDRDIINNIDVTGMLTIEVIVATSIKLDEYFKAWRLSEGISNILSNPNNNILNMTFKELYSLIHWNCHKQDFELTFFKTVA